jgi:hypothetical protein
VGGISYEITVGSIVQVGIDKIESTAGKDRSTKKGGNLVRR